VVDHQGTMARGVYIASLCTCGSDISISTLFLHLGVFALPTGPAPSSEDKPNTTPLHDRLGTELTGGFAASTSLL
jgi:hypothetical protein